MDRADILIGIDAGTSVIKAVAFDMAGHQIGAFSVPNRYLTAKGGAHLRTWRHRGVGKDAGDTVCHSGRDGKCRRLDRRDGTGALAQGNAIEFEITQTQRTLKIEPEHGIASAA